MPSAKFTVIVAVPAFTVFIVTVLPDAVAVATPASLVVALNTPSPSHVTATVPECHCIIYISAGSTVIDGVILFTAVTVYVAVASA